MKMTNEIVLVGHKKNVHLWSNLVGGSCPSYRGVLATILGLTVDHYWNRESIADQDPRLLIAVRISNSECKTARPVFYHVVQISQEY